MARRKVAVQFVDFRGGWVPDKSLEDLAANELAQADDVDPMEEIGGLVVRKKWLRLDDGISVTGTVYQLIDWPRDSGATTLLCVMGTTLYKVNGDGSLTLVQAMARNSAAWFTLQDKFYFADGTEYWEYTGAAVNTVVPNGAGDNDLGPFHRAKWFLQHPASTRIFAAGDSTDPTAITYSEPNDPTYRKSTSRLCPTSGDGPVTGMALLLDAVLVFYANSVWCWRGIDPTTDVEWTKLAMPHGTVSPAAIVLTPGSMAFLDRDGLMAVTPQIVEMSYVAEPGTDLTLDLGAAKVSSSVIAKLADRSACSAAYDGGKFFVEYHTGLAAYLLVLCWKLQCFTRYTVPARVYSMCRRVGGGLLIGMNGAIAALGDGAEDYTGPVVPVVATGWSNLGVPLTAKKMWKVFCLGDLPAGTFKVETRKASQTETLLVDATGFTWGDDWGGPWGRTQIPWQYADCRLLGDAFRFTVTGNGEAYVLRGLAAEFTPTRPKGVKMGG